MRRLLTAAYVLALAGACAPTDPREDGLSLHTSVEYVVAVPGSSDVVERAIAIVDSARESCWLAAETFTSVELADALVAAQARGVDVRTVGDVDLRGQAGFRRLAERLQPVFGELPMRYGDGPLVYNPQLVDTIAREGDHNRMTHNFVVCDEREVLGVTGGFGPADVHQVGFEATSLYLGRDYADEFNQMFGGIYAATLSAFNGPLKSITDNREWYDADVGRFEAYFGPQERPMKRVVDAVYAARSSVFVVAEELTSLPLANALRYKAEAGFDVRVVVADSGTDVNSSRYARLRNAFDALENAHITSAPDVAINAILLDTERSPISGRRHRARAFLLSEPLLAATSIVEGQTTVARAADAFSDSNLVVFNRWPDEPAGTVGAIVESLRPLLPEVE